MKVLIPVAVLLRGRAVTGAGSRPRDLALAGSQAGRAGAGGRAVGAGAGAEGAVFNLWHLNAPKQIRAVQEPVRVILRVFACWQLWPRWKA